MRIAYLEPFAGISGDMLLGAFVQAGVSVELLRKTADALGLGVTLDIRPVDRSGITSIKVDVLEKGHVAEAGHHHHAHEHSHGEHHHGAGDHHHDHGESTHHHREHHGRSLSEILVLIKKTSLPEPVKARASRAFELLGEVEAKIHNVPVEKIHFHEVGAVDAIVDIVLACAAVHELNVDAWHCAPLNVGGGTVECAHGRFPVPAPATAELLRGVPTYSSGIQMELVTPTGAALVRALDCRFGSMPAMKVGQIGYGAGNRNPAGFANVLRLCVGEAEEKTGPSAETVTVIETALDDLSPQVIAHVMEQALKKGALDVMCAPVLMKKNRPGHLLTILADPAKAPLLEELIFRETSTLGLRIREERRSVLDRRHVSVRTEWGEVRMKVGSREGREIHVASEFEDCRKISEERAVPLKRVQEAALQAYRQKSA